MNTELKQTINMDSKDFYVFSSKLSSSTFQAGALGLKSRVEDLLEADEYRLLKGDLSDFKFPIVFKQADGKILHDILDTGWASLYLISDNMKNILLENNISGWKSYPIKLYDRKNNEIQGYNGFSIIGKCNAKAKFRKDSMFEKRLIINGPLAKYYKGLNIDFTKWDGSDFFIPKGSLRIVITQNLQDIILNHKLTNVNIRNIKDIEVSDFKIKDEDLI
jgi:hypothetical protein